MSESVPSHRPVDEEEAAALLPELAADGPPPALTGSLPDELPDFVRAGLGREGRAVLSTERMAAVLDYRPEDLTVTVGSGARMSDVRDRLREDGQWIPLSARDLRRSAGGLVAAAPPTPYAAEYGPLRRQVLAVRIVSFAGERLAWGRGVVKDVAGFDMPRLTCGSRGRLGLVTRVTFRVWPLPDTRRGFALRADDAAHGTGVDPLTATVGVDADEDWRPEAETWRWAAGGDESPPLVVELAGSSASVDARRERLARWAEERGLRMGSAPSRGREPGAPARPTCLRFRMHPRYVGDAIDSLRGAAGTRRLTAHPREGLVTARLATDHDGAAAVESALRVAPGAAVEVARGRPELHERARGRRDPDRVELERRVLDALDGRRRAWAGDYV